MDVLTSLEKYDKPFPFEQFQRSFFFKFDASSQTKNGQEIFLPIHLW